ncbi:MAG: ROK family protein, partial [Solirubrobacteraceae bacterium]
MARSGFVVAFDFGGSKADVGCASLQGELLERVRLEIDAPRGAEQAVRRAVDAAHTLIAGMQPRVGGPCLAAGVVSPGIPGPDHVSLAPNVPGWQNLALGSLVGEGLGLQTVALGNDAKAAGLAELRWGSLAGADPGLYLSLGTGVSAAVLVNGRVVNGAHGAAGEIGYALRGVEDSAAFADGHAPLEEVAGGRFIGERASALAGRALTAEQAFAADDPGIAAVVDRALDELAVHVANLALVLDPQRIAVGGGLMGSADRVLEALARRLGRALPFAPEIVAARFTQDAA